MKNSVCSFVLMLLLVVLVTTVAVFGIGAFNLPGAFDDDAISKGLDLVGGSSITYVAQPDENAENFDMATALDTVESMLRQRLDTLGYTEATIAKMGTDRIRVEIPGIDDPEDALKKLGSTAKLEFLDSSGNVILEGKDVKEAVANYGQTSESSMGSQYYVSLTFNDSGRQKFADATEKMAKLASSSKNYIDIELDGENISRASVSYRIDSDSCMISGNFTKDEAVYLAELISSGQLPVVLREIELRYVGPTLGSEALASSIKAGLIGTLIVMLFMILVYRLPGLVSAIALVSYISIFAILIIVFKVNLSLPGIAGIILTIGMAVDSNVVIYERIKEELNTGKSTRAAVKSGFSRAFSAILDSNVTTIIASIVLRHRCRKRICNNALHRRCGLSLHRTLRNARSSQLGHQHGCRQMAARCQKIAAGVTEVRKNEKFQLY